MNFTDWTTRDEWRVQLSCQREVEEKLLEDCNTFICLRIRFCHDTLINAKHLHKWKCLRSKELVKRKLEDLQSLKSSIMLLFDDSINETTSWSKSMLECDVKSLFAVKWQELVTTSMRMKEVSTQCSTTSHGLSQMWMETSATFNSNAVCKHFWGSESTVSGKSKDKAAHILNILGALMSCKRVVPCLVSCFSRAANCSVCTKTCEKLSFTAFNWRE